MKANSTRKQTGKIQMITKKEYCVGKAMQTTRMPQPIGSTKDPQTLGNLERTMPKPCFWGAAFYFNS